MKCNKCGNELPKDSMFCQVCGTKIETNELKSSISDTSNKNIKSIKCPQCESLDLVKTKNSFFSFSQKYVCNKCDYLGPLLLKESTRMAWGALTLLLLLGLIYSIISGTPAGVGFLGIVVIGLYVQDVKYRNMVNSYREKNSLPQYKSGEKNSLVKGVVYVFVIVSLFILVGYYLGE